MDATLSNRPILSRILFALLAAGLGLFIASWVEPTYKAIAHGQMSLRKGEVPIPSPLWAATGAVLGLMLGLIGQQWQVRGRLLAAILGAGVGTIAGGAFAAASSAVSPPTSRPSPTRGEYWDLYTRQVMTEGIALGAWIGAVTGLMVWWAGRQSRISPTEPTASENAEVAGGTSNTVQPSVQSYALAIDLDIAKLQADGSDPDSPTELGLSQILQRHGFNRHHGTVHYGDESVTAVTCVLAAQDLARSLPGFATSVREMRMLRVGVSDDLMPAVQRAVGS